MAEIPQQAPAGSPASRKLDPAVASDIAEMRQQLLRGSGTMLSYLRKHAPRRFDAWQQAEREGRPEGLLLMAGCYYDGIGVDRDVRRALRDLTRAAEMRFPPAMVSLAAMYADGGVDGPPDYAAAVKWLQRAADANDAVAMHDLALMHRWGRGVPMNSAKAVEWMRKAADGGSLSSTFAVFGRRFS